jgi:hypothetical protein
MTISTTSLKLLGHFKGHPNNLQKNIFSFLFQIFSPDNAAGIANSYGLDGREVGARVSVGPKDLSSICPEPLWCLVDIEDSFPGVKAAETCSLPLISQ